MRIVQFGTLLLAAACSSSTSTGGGGPTTGALTITVSAPAGVSARVTVLGPAGYRSTITSSQTISGLSVGSYSVNAEPGTTTDPIVGKGYAGTVTGSPASIVAGDTSAATVTFSTAWSATGKLFVANALGKKLTGYTSAQLTATGFPTPAVIVGNGTASSTVQSPQGLAVDATGGVWMVNGGDTVRYFTSAQANANGNPAPARTIISSALKNPTGITIDVAGNVWIADLQTHKVHEFTAAQAATGGTLSPAVTLSANAGSIAHPVGIAFDKTGNLWVVNYFGNSITAFSPAQLAASGSPVPVAAVSGSQGTTGPSAAAFDAAGNLWVASTSDTLAEFRASDLNSVGAPAPAVIITGNVLNDPFSLAFDNSGALWVASYGGNYIMRFTSAQLATSGAPTPGVKVGSGATMGLPASIAFSPAPQNIPIQ